MEATRDKSVGVISITLRRIIAGLLLVAAGLAMLALTGCAADATRTASRAWSWCDDVQQGRPTVVCLQQ